MFNSVIIQISIIGLLYLFSISICKAFLCFITYKIAIELVSSFKPYLIDWNMFSAIGTVTASFVAVASYARIKRDHELQLKKETLFNLEDKVEKTLTMFQEVRHIINVLEASLGTDSFKSKDELEQFYKEFVVPVLTRNRSLVRSYSFLFFENFFTEFEQYLNTLDFYISKYKEFAECKYRFIFFVVNGPTIEDESKRDNEEIIKEELHRTYNEYSELDKTLSSKLLDFVSTKRKEVTKY